MHQLDSFSTTESSKDDRKAFERFFDTLDEDFQNQILTQLQDELVSFDLLIENYLKKDRALQEEDETMLEEVLEEELTLLKEFEE